MLFIKHHTIFYLSKSIVILIPIFNSYFEICRESSEKVYSGKIIRFSHNFFKALYFLIVAGCAYSFLSEEPFFPAEFGGPGLMLSSTSSNLSVFKYSVAQSALITPVALPFIKYYFLVSAGFQLGNFYFLLVESQHSDLWETLAQVALALQLIFYGYTAKHLAVGSCLLLMHDVCDILTSACKALVHTTCKVSTFMGSMVLMVIWAYARLYCFGKLILIPMLREIEQQPPWKTSNIESSLFAILLLSLFFMNIYWWVYFYRYYIIESTVVLVMNLIRHICCFLLQNFSSSNFLFFQVFVDGKICNDFC